MTLDKFCVKLNLLVAIYEMTVYSRCGVQSKCTGLDDFDLHFTLQFVKLHFLTYNVNGCYQHYFRLMIDKNINLAVSIYNV